MPTIKVQPSVPANGQIDNALAGNQYEFLPGDAQVSFAVIAAAAGVVMDIFSGSDMMIENGVVSPANRSPIYPDDFDLVDVASAGERMKVRLRNTTGAAIIVNVTVRIDPL